MSTDTKSVAEAFTALLKEGKDREAGERFWADDVVSLEPMEGDMARLEGPAAIRGKHDWWEANFTVHGGDITGPYIHGDQFAIFYSIEVTGPDGKRVAMQEVALYSVRGGKVVEERFFGAPDMPGA
ncbi:MAG: nuclear transport factor 2 family protein [Pseudomonadota bacterium]